MDFVRKHKEWVALVLIFSLHLFLRFYQIESRNPFGFDQVDNAWAAKNIIIDHKFPLLGPFIKGASSGIRLGPLYYYFITSFYWVFNLDPFASGVFAGITSIFTFFVLFYVTQKLFSTRIALLAVFINTVSFSGIFFDRVQWNVNFIPSISLLIFYFLYKVVTGNERYLIFLAIAIGFFFHIHLTAIFFPLIILLALPFFPKTHKTLKYTLIALPFFLIWLVPNAISLLQSKAEQSSQILRYFNTYYHGIHLKRIFQLLGDALIQFEPYFTFSALKSLKFILLPLFFFIYLYESLSRKRLILSYLMLLWFLVPWFVLATYSGEISDYYFSINRFLALIALSYLIFRLFEIKSIILKICIIIFAFYYSLFSLQKFFSSSNIGLDIHSKEVKEAIRNGKVIEFKEGDPDSYLYYIYTRKKDK